jgi:hypothetical protein
VAADLPGFSTGFNSSIVKTPYSFNTITDFLISQPLTIDVEIDDQYSGCFSVKGIEFEATVLYAGISDFARLSIDLSPSEMLIYLNMFLVWMRESSHTEQFCVLERFLDNAIVLLFSKRFGSEDPFVDALQVARWMGDHDAMMFCPDIGIASGKVMAGFTSTPREYSASVFGRPMILAAGCARLKHRGNAASVITFPAEEWRTRSLADLFKPIEYDDPVKGKVKQPQTWILGDPRTVDFPGTGSFALRDIANFIHSTPSLSAEKKAKEWVELIRAKGFYKKHD